MGNGTVAIIDPGPADAAHIDAVAAAVAGEQVSHLVITHTHMDHSPAAVPLRERFGAEVAGCVPLVLQDDGPRADAGFDPTYAPDRVLRDGEAVCGPGWTLRAVQTPGHTSNHLCYALSEERALFSGDHVMGWSTTVVAPPDGDMADYMASLKLLLGRDDVRYYATHGQPIEEPQRLVKHLMAHRRQRETQILGHVDAGVAAIPAMVALMYASVDKRLWGGAGRSVLAHLIDLEARGLVAREDDLWTRV